jgi:hypothetical protein
MGFALGSIFVLSIKKIKQEKFSVISKMCDKNDKTLWKVLINDKKDFYRNFKTVPPGTPYDLNDWIDDIEDGAYTMDIKTGIKTIAFQSEKEKF